MGIEVVIPSHKRSDRVAAVDAVTGAILCVPESQAAAYREHNPDTEILTHADSLVGLARKRQWIYERFGDVCMVDDDVHAFRRIYRSTTSRLTPDEARAMLEATATTCRALGAYLFGVSMVPNPKFYRPFRPFRLSGFVNGACLGLLRGSRLFFDPRAVAVEDYFISGLNAHFHRHCFIDQRFGFEQEKTFSNPGGQAEFRTGETERQDYAFLRSMFGSAIRLKAAKQGGWGRSSRWERELDIPF